MKPVKSLTSLAKSCYVFHPEDKTSVLNFLENNKFKRGILSEEVTEYGILPTIYDHAEINGFFILMVRNDIQGVCNEAWIRRIKVKHTFILFEENFRARNRALLAILAHCVTNGKDARIENGHLISLVNSIRLKITIVKNQEEHGNGSTHNSAKILGCGTIENIKDEKDIFSLQKFENTSESFTRLMSLYGGDTSLPYIPPEERQGDGYLYEKLDYIFRSFRNHWCQVISEQISLYENTACYVLDDKPTPKEKYDEEEEKNRIERRNDARLKEQSKKVNENKSDGYLVETIEDEKD